VSERALRRTSVVDELAAVLRDEILEAVIPAGAPLREVELSERFSVSRHTLRAALRELASEGVVQIEPHRGARVAALDPSQLRALLELRTALELEAARLALVRHGGVLPEPVHAALRVLVAATRRTRPSWAAIAAAHADLHGAIVRAAGSPRIEAEYERLAVELSLFVLQLRPVWSLERMREHHEELVAGLERHGAEVLRRHLEEGAAAVLTPRSRTGG
jgi:DNA-binding GntR family transcriptional regulator